MNMKMIMTALAFTVSIASADTIDLIKPEDITSENISIAMQQYKDAKEPWLAVQAVRLGKIGPVEAAQINPTNVQWCRYIFADSKTSTDREAVKAVFFNTVDPTTLTKKERDLVVGLADWYRYETPGQIDIIKAKILPKDKVLGTACLAYWWWEAKRANFPEAIVTSAAETFNALTPTDVNACTNIGSQEWAMLFATAIDIKKDPAFARAIYRDGLWSKDNLFDSVFFNTCLELEDLRLTAIKSYINWSSTTKEINWDIVKRGFRYLGKKNALSTEIADKVYAIAPKSTDALDIALELNSNDKIIETLIKCDTTLTPAQIEKAILILNALDPDYKPAEILKALKAVNQRYTLNLYDDRDTWEPIISKVRALIDLR